MPTKIVVVGDKTSHGGIVISGSPSRDINGKAIARVGDNVACPMPYPGGKPHGVNKITSGHSSLFADGIPVAVHGSSTECGCTLIGSVNAYAE